MNGFDTHGTDIRQEIKSKMANNRNNEQKLADWKG